MPGFLIALEFLLGLIIKRWQQIKRNIGRLEMARVGSGDVVAEATERGGARKNLEIAAIHQRRGVPPSTFVGNGALRKPRLIAASEATRPAPATSGRNKRLKGGISV